MENKTPSTFLKRFSAILNAIWFFFPGILFVVLGLIAFSMLPQGVDLMQQSLQHSLGGKLMIILGLAFWSFTSWYCSRILAYNNDDLYADAPETITLFPRLIGFLVFTVVGIGLGHAQDTDDWPYWFIVVDAILFIVIYQLAKRAKKLEAFATGGKNITRSAIGLTVLGFVLLLLFWNVQILNLLILMMIQIGALLWVSFRNSQTLESSYDFAETKENDWINWAIKLIYFNHVTNLEKNSKKKDQSYFFYTERNIFIGYQTTALIATLSYFAIIFFIPVGRSVGSFVFVLLAFGILLGVGNILTFLSFKSKTNWHFIVIAIIAIAGFLVEPHWVRTIKLDQINSYKQRPDLKSYLEKWVNDPIRANVLAQNSVTTFPVFFILADGGASRSGYWAASLLSGLHDSTRIKGQTASFFQQHLLGLAGASGGSVGNITFVTALAAQHKNPSLLSHKLCTNFLKADFLTHPLARLLGNVIDLKKKSECESLFLSHHTSKKLNTLAMRTKVKNILSGMKDFVQTVLKKRKEYFVDEHVFTRNRRLDFSNLCFF